MDDDDMSNEPQDPDTAHVGDPGSEPEEQTPVGDEAEQSPLVDDVTAQSGDDTAPETESEMESPEPPAESESEPESQTVTPESETEPESGPESETVTVTPESDAGSDGLGFEPPPPQPGPIYQAPPPVRRLTRDPYSRLGGVASGIAHYYGIDVSLVRLAFVAFAVLTGVGFLLYFVAWLVIPRAEVWPPPPPPGGYRGGRMDNRQLALGLIALGLLIAVFAGAGAGVRVLIALGLVAGGIWIFNQRPAPAAMPVAGPDPEPVPPAYSDAAVGASSTASSTSTADATTQWPTQTATTTTPGPSDSSMRWSSDAAGDQTGFESPYSGATGGSGGYEPPGQGYYQATAYPPPQPVPPRRRRIWPWVLIGVLLLAPVMAIGALFAAFAALEGGDLSFSTDGDGEYLVEADVPEEIPLRIREGAGQLTIDLADLDVEDFADEDVPVPVEVDMTAGQIVVDLPEDLPVRIDADIGAAGEIEVFNNSREGFRPQYSLSEPDPVLELDIHLGVGEILVER
jgi:phage shock protein PspC (stress-responsive transcriptional regulator)